MVEIYFYQSRNGTGDFNRGFVLGDRWQHEIVGASNQRAPASDLEVGNALRNNLFSNVDKDTKGNRIPGDLVARNIQRARDHGIPGYDALRQACGMKALSRYEAPEEINSTTWKRLLSTYKNDLTQIDGFTGGLAETSPHDGMVRTNLALLMTCLLSGGTALCLHHQDAVPEVEGWRQILLHT